MAGEGNTEPSIIKEKLVQQVKLLAIPMDFDERQAQGILQKRGAWYEVLDRDWFPEHAAVRVTEMQCTGKRLLVKFQKSTKAMEKLRKRLTA